MTDFIITYNSKDGWNEINKHCVSNIMEVYGDEVRLHIYGIGEWSPLGRIKRILEFISNNSFDNAVFLDTDTIINKKLDVFNTSDWDLGVTIRNIPYYAPHKNIPVHNYFNMGVIFFRPTAKPFFEKWVIEMEKHHMKGREEHFIDQSPFAKTVLEGKFSIEGTEAYKQGLRPGIIFENNGVRTKVFDCYNYNCPMPIIGRNQYILHFKDDTMPKANVTHMLRQYTNAWRNS